MTDLLGYLKKKKLLCLIVHVKVRRKNPSIKLWRALAQSTKGAWYSYKEVGVNLVKIKKKLIYLSWKTICFSLFFYINMIFFLIQSNIICIISRGQSVVTVWICNIRRILCTAILYPLMFSSGWIIKYFYWPGLCHSFCAGAR